MTSSPAKDVSETTSYQNKLKPRKCSPRLLVLVLLFAAFLILVYFTYRESTVDLHLLRLLGRANRTEKIILYWTPFFEGADLEQGWQKERFSFHQCNVSNCVSTSNRKALLAADAVVMFVREIKDLPTTQRNPSQRWVLMFDESPAHVDFDDSKHVKKLNGMINWTMTYRKDSDIDLSYGKIIPRDNETDPPFDWQALERRVKKKTKMAVWMVSNCGAKNRRQDVAKGLQRHLAVDIFGKCKKFPGHKNLCQGSSKEAKADCMKFINNNYKFYLAFENSMCEEYITEKVYDRMRYDLVPVVLGYAKHAASLPPKSYISVEDFESVKDLANYLIYLDVNLTAYMEYFEWKKTAKAVVRFQGDHRKAWCELCAKLNRPSHVITVYQDIMAWWGKCVKANWSNFLKDY